MYGNCKILWIVSIEESWSQELKYWLWLLKINNVKQKATSRAFLSTYTTFKFEDPKLSGILPVSWFDDRSLIRKRNITEVAEQSDKSAIQTSQDRIINLLWLWCHNYSDWWHKDIKAIKPSEEGITFFSCLIWLPSNFGM